MSNLVTARIAIRGTRPLLWHRFGPDALPLEKQERSGVAGNDPSEWRRTVLALPDTFQLYIEGAYIFSCLRDAARFTRKGRGSIQGIVAATLQVGDDRILLEDRALPFGFDEPPPADPTAPVYLDVRGVRNPVTKARNVRYRIACSPGWACRFSLLWDKTVVSRNEMEAVLADAGKLVGLGSGRSIGFGRFDVVEADIVLDA